MAESISKIQAARDELQARSERQVVLALFPFHFDSCGFAGDRAQKASRELGQGTSTSASASSRRIRCCAHTPVGTFRVRALAAKGARGAHVCRGRVPEGARKLRRDPNHVPKFPITYTRPAPCETRAYLTMYLSKLRKLDWRCILRSDGDGSNEIGGERLNSRFYVLY